MTDADGHDGDGSKGVAHDHREECHTDGEDNNSYVYIALGNDFSDQLCDYFTDTGFGKYCSQTGKRMGSMLSGPTTDSSRDESSRNTFGVFLRE